MTEEKMIHTKGSYDTYVAMHDRYITLYDEQDYIEDTHTGEYMTLEDACNLLNDMTDRLEILEGFTRGIFKRIWED